MSKWAAKDPNAVDSYFIVWCSKDGTNDGGADDLGELQGATISTSNWTITPGSELIEDSENTGAVTIRGVSYPINTVATIKVSAGTDGSDYQVSNRITTSDGRTLDKTEILRVRSQ